MSFFSCQAADCFCVRCGCLCLARLFICHPALPDSSGPVPLPAAALQLVLSAWHKCASQSHCCHLQEGLYGPVVISDGFLQAGLWVKSSLACPINLGCVHFPPQKAQGELGGHPPSTEDTMSPSFALDLDAAAVFDSCQGLRDVSLQSSAIPRADATRIPARGCFSLHPASNGSRCAGSEESTGGQYRDISSKPRRSFSLVC